MTSQMAAILDLSVFHSIIVLQNDEKTAFSDLNLQK